MTPSITNHEFLSQSPHTCKLDWGLPGTKRAVARKDIIILVDTLSFSTTVTYAVSKGACIYPCATTERARILAVAVDCEIAVGRKDVPSRGRYSLSPSTYDNIAPGANIILPSPNGSTCSRACTDIPYTFLGALVNAGAVAGLVTRLLADGSHGVTIIACGEREKEPNPGGDLRPAIEDYLGAGAIISSLDCLKSPEARVCETAFTSSLPNLSDLIWDCASGRELRELGFPDDITFASRLNALDTVPILKESHFTNQR